MIFLTLGTQLPFDRLVRAVDAAAGHVDETVFGQIGASTVQPVNMDHVDYMAPTSFTKVFAEARVIIGHAGMGTILQASQLEKPLIIMARRASLGEHRNDHQAATVAHFRHVRGIYVVETADDIKALLDDHGLAPMSSEISPERTQLTTRLRREVFGELAPEISEIPPEIHKHPV